MNQIARWLPLTGVVFVLLALIGCASSSGDDSASSSGGGNVLTIEINPAAEGATVCELDFSGRAPEFDPNPASVAVGESFRFTNNDAEIHTIESEGGGVPWTTVNPGETSGSLVYSAVGEYHYRSALCYVTSSISEYAILYVTVN